MGQGERTLEGLHATWRQVGIDPAGLGLREDGTVVSDGPALGAAASSETETLPLLAGHEQADLVLGRVLGEGGMGRVHLARQRSLRRDVAVKVTHEEAGEATRGALLREAWVAGALEHPAMVPVHALGRDPLGRPLIAMKRLEGQTWGAHLDATRGREEHLATHLPILERVCQAVRFAHARGVLHRDLKPENVMLGEFGEVYVVDWGLAVSLGETDVPGLRRAAEVSRIEGTLQYMAPEMATGRGVEMGPHTDVYLLGAILHEILTGRPPHLGDGIHATLFHAYTSPAPRFGPDVPPELGAICAKAMHVSPGERHPDAGALAEALREFQRGREAYALAAEARARLDELEGQDALGRADTADLGVRLAEARFAAEQALRIRPGDHELRALVARALALAVERELASEQLDAAEALLARLDGQRPELAARVEALRRSLDERRARVRALERAERERDLGQAARTRRAFGIGFGVALLAANVACGTLERAGVARVGFFEYLAATGGVAAVFAAPTIFLRETLYPNQANRRLALVLALILIGQVLTFAAMGWLGVAVRAALAVSLVQLAASIAIKTLLMDPRVAWTAAVALACGALGVLLPEAAFELVGVAYGTFFVAGAALSWETSGEAAPTGSSRPGDAA